MSRPTPVWVHHQSKARCLAACIWGAHNLHSLPHFIQALQLYQGSSDGQDADSRAKLSSVWCAVTLRLHPAVEDSHAGNSDLYRVFMLVTKMFSCGPWCLLCFQNEVCAIICAHQKSTRAEMSSYNWPMEACATVRAETHRDQAR
jgi:hypothetical protein